MDDKDNFPPEEKPLMCTECYQVFLHSSDLMHHLKSHLKTKSSRSQTLDAPVLEESGDTQMFEHSEQKPHLCDDCGEAFSRADELSDHTRSHFKDGRYVCEECGETFSQADELKTHVFNHSRETSCTLNHKSPLRTNARKRFNLLGKLPHNPAYRKRYPTKVSRVTSDKVKSKSGYRALRERRVRARCPSLTESNHDSNEETPLQTSAHADQSASNLYSDGEDSNASAHSPIPRKRSKTSTNLSEEQEETMVEWLAMNPIIYNKKSKMYKDTAKKRALWEEKGEEMGMAYDVLEVWYRSIRTRYGKLLVKRSGEAELTERDNWILDSFNFLFKFIVRCKKKTILKEKMSAHTRTQSEPTTEVYMVSDDDDSQVPDTQEQSISRLLPNLSTQTFKNCHPPKSITESQDRHLSKGITESQDRHPSKGINEFQDKHPFKYSKANESLEAVRADEVVPVQTMSETVEALRSLRDQILSCVPERATDRSVFGDWAKQNMNYIHPSLWRKYQSDAFSLMMKYHDETDQINTPLHDQIYTPAS